MFLTGVAFSYNIGFIIFGVLAPVIITASINAGTIIMLTPIVYLLCMVITSGVGLRLLEV